MPNPSMAKIMGGRISVIPVIVIILIGEKSTIHTYMGIVTITAIPSITTMTAIVKILVIYRVVHNNNFYIIQPI